MNSVIKDELDDRGVSVATTRGDSMEPFLSDRRDVVIIRRREPEERLKKYDVALYKREGQDRYVLHRVVRVRKNDYAMLGDNRRKIEYGVTDDQILGVLIRVNRKGKEIGMKDRRYMLYVRIWYLIYPIRSVIMIMKEVLNIVERRVGILK